jgi:Family of unknown function (DUF6152)
MLKKTGFTIRKTHNVRRIFRFTNATVQREDPQVEHANSKEVLMRTWKIVAAAVVAFGVLLFVKPILAHHSEAAEYDLTKPVKVTGTIKSVEWKNPHIWFYVDVKDENGKVTTWGFSGGPPGMLLRRGITKDVMKIGTVVNVEGSRAKDGSNNASGRKVTFPDGKNVFTASAEDVAR